MKCIFDEGCIVKIQPRGATAVILLLQNQKIKDDMLRRETFVYNSRLLLTVADVRPADLSYVEFDFTKLDDIRPNVADYPNDDPIFSRSWNSQAWLSEFKKAKCELDLSKKNTSTHRLRIGVMLSTLAACRKERYTTERGTTVSLEGKHQLLNNTYYTNQSEVLSNYSPELARVTTVDVINIDCCDQMKIMKNEHRLNPVMLNMASATSPGGGYRKGDGAQEVLFSHLKQAFIPVYFDE